MIYMSNLFVLCPAISILLRNHFMPNPLDKELAYLYRLERFEKIKLGLTVMEKLLAALDNPHLSYPTLHIAGTNGKGSTAAFLSNTLSCAGYRTALYTSPHLRRFNE